jgi:hypothetical protein
LGIRFTEGEFFKLDMFGSKFILRLLLKRNVSLADYKTPTSETSSRAGGEGSRTLPAKSCSS